MRDPLPPSLPLAELEGHAEGLVCLSGCARDGAVAGRWERGDIARRRGDGAPAALGVRARAASASSCSARSGATTARATAGSPRSPTALGVPCVATGNVHAHDRSRLALQDALVAIRANATLDETEGMRRGNSAAVLMSPAEAAARFRDHPEAVAESARLAERLRFDLTRDLGYSYPGAEDETADAPPRGALPSRCWASATPRARPTAPRPSGGSTEELRLIASLKLSGFFLLHHEMLELAREVALEVRGPSSARRLLPPGRGRGSSVSSIVCYLTGLSHIDPVRNDLFLGRFLNEELDSTSRTSTSTSRGTSARS